MKIHLKLNFFLDPKYQNVKFSSIYIRPSLPNKDEPFQAFEQASVPLIVWPHGGPHAISLTSYNKDVSFFNKLGFGVLLVIFIEQFLFFLIHEGLTCVSLALSLGIKLFSIQLGPKQILDIHFWGWIYLFWCFTWLHRVKILKTPEECVVV